jgi:hypothetical protein
MLDSGDAYRAGYGAVLRASRGIPPPHAITPPVLITAYDGDPLQPHIDRLGVMPASWSARKVATPAEQEAVTLAFLQAHLAPDSPEPVETAEEGFVAIEGHQMHWRGQGQELRVHAPGRSVETLAGNELAIDLPGHGLSDPWSGESWNTLIESARRRLGAARVVHDPVPVGDPHKLFPHLAPDRFGTHLTRAWQIVRARHLFEPWYEARASHALDFEPGALAPDRLAIEHRELLRASAAHGYMTHLGGR